MACRAPSAATYNADGLGRCAGLCTSAVIGASHPEQIIQNAVATDVTLPPDALVRIEDALREVAVVDPARTADFTPKVRPI